MTMIVNILTFCMKAIMLVANIVYFVCKCYSTFRTNGLKKTKWNNSCKNYI